MFDRRGAAALCERGVDAVKVGRDRQHLYDARRSGSGMPQNHGDQRVRGWPSASGAGNRRRRIKYSAISASAGAARIA